MLRFTVTPARNGMITVAISDRDVNVFTPDGFVTYLKKTKEPRLLVNSVADLLDLPFVFWAAQSGLVKSLDVWVTPEVCVPWQDLALSWRIKDYHRLAAHPVSDFAYILPCGDHAGLGRLVSTMLHPAYLRKQIEAPHLKLSLHRRYSVLWGHPNTTQLAARHAGGHYARLAVLHKMPPTDVTLTLLRHIADLWEGHFDYKVLDQKARNKWIKYT
jgi:hypothetical protein